MGIILKGKPDDEKKIREELRKHGKDDLRSLGYLLYELAGLANLAAIESRLDEIIARHREIKDKPGMQKEKLPIDAEKLKETLTQMMQALCDGNYMQTIAARKSGTILNASKWTPSNATDAAAEYLRYLMRKFAAEFIAESGGQS